MAANWPDGLLWATAGNGDCPIRADDDLPVRLRQLRLVNLLFLLRLICFGQLLAERAQPNRRGRESTV